MYLDMHEKWDVIKNHVSTGIRSLFPIEGPKGKVELTDLEIREPEKSIGAQRDAIIRGNSLTAPVYGTFKLTDSHGSAIDTAKIKILDLPVITQRGTFVVQGKDYSVFNQMRLRPGVYTTKSEESGDVTTRFNLGKGLGFKIELSPKDGVFYVRFDKSRASTSSPKIPLYSLLRILGAPEGEIKSRWGDRVFESNAAKSHLQEDAHKIVELTIYSTKRTGNDVADILDYFKGTQLNGDTTKVTLGNSYEKVEAGALLDSSAKMIKVYSGASNEDDMDSLLFKEVLSVEDHLMLRIQKGIKDTGLLIKIKRKLGEEKDLRKIIPTNMLSKLVESFYTTSSLSSPQTEINPIEILETNHKITAMGEGGIKSEHGIPMSARNLHPSHLGFLDPVRTTESTRVGVDLRMTHNAYVKDRNIYSTFLDKKGNKVDLRPIDLSGKVVGFPGQEGEQTVRALVDGEMKDVPRNTVDYWLDQAKDMFTHTSNIVPFLHNDQGNRITMASRMVTQAVPLTNREAPLVQIKDNSSYGTVQKKIGTEYFLPKSPIDGTVTEVDRDHIMVNDQKVGIYSNFPLNLKTSLNMEPVVKVGDKVHKGQILAESNFTKDGTLALGTNLRVAYLSFQGNHEDAAVCSETTAKKLTSQHMYVKEIEKNDDITVDKNRLIKFFPSRITADQMRKLDDEGVAKKGELISKGDYVIAALAKRDLTQADQMLTKLRGGLANPYKDVSQIWDHDRPGTVTDVIRNGNLVKVILVTEDETRTGDKMCYSDDTEVLTKRGWIPFPELTMQDMICCLNPETGAVQYDYPTLVKNWDHNGEMYHIKNTYIDHLVTPDHHMWVKGRNDDEYRFIQARDIYGKRVKYKKTALNTKDDISKYVLGTEHDMDAWLLMLGYFISEGSTCSYKGNYSVSFSQSKEVHPETYRKIVDVLKKLGFNPHERPTDVVVHNKELYAELSKMGLSYEKRIPKYALELSTRQSLILLEALMDGDGYWSSTTGGVYTSTSKGLCDDVSVLALNCEYTARVLQTDGERVCTIKGKDYKCRPLYRCRISTRHTDVTVNHGHVSKQRSQVEERVLYTGKVYCCTVPTHVLFVRRNGKSSFCGNTGVHGNKCTIVKILPDHEMPKDAKGKPVDMVWNTAGVISRVNPG